MSTKIYNGYVLSAEKSLFELNDFMEDVRKMARKEVIHHMASIISERYYGHLDNKKLCPEAEDVTIGDIMIDIQNNLRENLFSGYAKNSIQIIPFNNKIYMISFIGLKAVSDEFEEMVTKFGFKQYGYWDNSDRPEDVSENEWLERKMSWDGIFERSSVPAEHGFSKVLTDVHTSALDLYVISGDKDEFIKPPPMSLRLRNLFESNLGEKMEEIKKENPGISENVAYSRALRFYDSKEGAKEKELIMGRLKDLIEGKASPSRKP